MKADSILKAVDSVTKVWTKQRKAEERGRARARSDVLVRSTRVGIKYAAWRVMKEAYLKASGGGEYPASARQIYYPARPPILKATGRGELDSQYFTQKVLPDYIANHPDETADWDVVYDARGHFAEPHTELIVPLGTLDVRRYLRKINEHRVTPPTLEDFMPDMAFPTCGPANRFRAALFTEKEGFIPLYQAVHLAERYDIAIMSTKGMPVVACRQLADALCGEHQIPLLVLHDFDKSGFSILGTLTGVEKYDRNGNPIQQRYEYRHAFEVIDLGLRLEDVQAYKLEHEVVHYRNSNPRQNLKDNGATEEEIVFLCKGNSGWGNSGERVELNAFTSDVFVQWIESKLQANGIKKVIPDQDTLTEAYRRALQVSIIEDRLTEIIDEAAQEAEEATVPKTLKSKVARYLKAHPEVPWDRAVAKIAADDL